MYKSYRTCSKDQCAVIASVINRIYIVIVVTNKTDQGSSRTFFWKLFLKIVFLTSANSNDFLIIFLEHLLSNYDIRIKNI